MKAAYTLRLPEELQDKIKEEAKRSKMSINQYILYTLTRDISYREAERALKNRIKQAPSREEALRLLETVVPDVPPLPGDEMLPANG
ncbi:MAG: toxin-antitoxin system HicB family antitoxin [Proteobacteria bacterium]|nr:toxin-antitoxin system HicB family antitoxin [Pseudomonadota bacterium]